MPSKTSVDIDGKKVILSNLEKIFYEEKTVTKSQVIDYYIRIAPVLLPHLHNRPLTLKRYPNGAAAKYFYQKACPAHRPEWLHTTPVWSNRNNKYIDFCIVNDLASLVWAANLATLELHTSLSLESNATVPTMLVLDLDPGYPAGILECAQVSLLLHEYFNSKGLKTFAKTSGSKGLQVYVPLNTTVSYDQTKQFAKNLAQSLEKQYPNLILSKMRKSLRQGKVFIDWSQNDSHKTTVCVYSLRAGKNPLVSAPVTWDELKNALNTTNAQALTFDSLQVLDRVKAHGDLFAPVLALQQQLPAP
ncbi:hypothetical protein P22_3116 [Propionispora sp. 2/2-37]|uniref:non-homologous end-joining DNA ligase n=1 Tax=Propionispora sp. 2/2-37 TaxID=1677858 RepID=UPI0006BB9706|nr:non-homologous end-joining DNA ligase [Propionispora sp. 2/2-37]CUH96990.1 hypothetical protein P22_3116 [Propionispora sp. 2/2-37]